MRRSASVFRPAVICGRRGEESRALVATKMQKETNTHRTMGRVVNHFLAGVYWAPESICSHSVRLSYTPELLVMSNGTPVT